jgi:hypothetical protein
MGFLVQSVRGGKPPAAAEDRTQRAGWCRIAARPTALQAGRLQTVAIAMAIGACAVAHLLAIACAVRSAWSGFMAASA